MSGKPTPAGVLLLAILDVLGGLILALIGMVISYILFIEVGDLALAQASVEELIGQNILTQIVLALGPILTVTGVFLLVIGIGLLKGKSWARIAAIMYFAVIFVSGFLFLPSGIVAIVIAGLVIYYLFTPGVKSFFGKPQPIESRFSAVPPMPLSPPLPPPPPEEGIKYCGSCGTEMPQEALFCPECGEKQQNGIVKL